jgi:hypothetical protein
MSLPIPTEDQLNLEEWRSLIHMLRDYQNSTEDDEEFDFWDNVIDKLYIYQITQFSK